MTRRLALVLAAALPLAALAQTPPAPVEPAAVVAPAPAAAPVAAPAPAALTIDWGGWLVFNSFFNSGNTSAPADLPARATAGLPGEHAVGMQVRQSRLRAVLGLPGGGLLGDAKLKGLVEIDFMGGGVGGDASLPLLRLRHAWAAATWKDLGNLTLTVGQTWGVFTGPYFATSLGHLALPRFAGAGFLYRRAPQLRLSGDLGGAVALKWDAALLAPMDKATAGAVVTSGAGVGERSGLPDVEARVAVVYRPEKKNMFELGVSGHYGEDKYLVTGNANKTVPSQGMAVDFKLDVSMVTLVGSAFSGDNIDVWATVTPGVRAGAGTPPATVDAISTKGGWVQLQVTPVAGWQLLLGGGMEKPTVGDLPVSATTVKENQQLSAGLVVNVAPKWRAALEYTEYKTTYNDTTPVKQTASQVELSTLYAF
ncbi:MAG: hypothetical protein IPO09_00810 [Anaeromyxobacter sp.]|nr:hypothetical protein [Anaeromyxobacter sp.]